MTKYTEDIHVLNLLFLLENSDYVCSLCPKNPEDNFHPPTIGELIDTEWKDETCAVCQQFVGMPEQNILTEGVIAPRWCPCIFLGREKAIKRTWLALEEKGVI